RENAADRRLEIQLSFVRIFTSNGALHLKRSLASRVPIGAAAGSFGDAQDAFLPLCDQKCSAPPWLRSTAQPAQDVHLFENGPRPHRGESRCTPSFGVTAELYERGRPEYPSESLRWILTSPHADEARLRVADVGAGTGKLTRAIAAAGHEVVAVDPDVAMLNTLRDVVLNVPTFVGTAESLPFPDASFDAVVLAQAWHWVDPVAGCREIGRVLAPGGVLGLVWNLRDVSEPWVRQLSSIVDGGAALDMFADGAPPIADPFDSLNKQEWHWKASMKRRQISASILSRSQYIKASPAAREKI
ncbi:unnamed protein product, partial [Oppiella nova]